MFPLCCTAPHKNERHELKPQFSSFTSFFQHYGAFTADPWYLHESTQGDAGTYMHQSCTRAPVDTRPAHTHSRAHTRIQTKVNKWQSDGNYRPGWNNGDNGRAAPMFSLIKAEFSSAWNNNPLDKMKCLQVHAWAPGGLNRFRLPGDTFGNTLRQLRHRIHHKPATQAHYVYIYFKPINQYAGTVVKSLCSVI